MIKLHECHQSKVPINILKYKFNPYKYVILTLGPGTKKPCNENKKDQKQNKTKKKFRD